MDEQYRKFDAIVCLSAIDWDFLWQRTQEVMSQFASMGYPVLFVENTGVRTPGFKDIPRVFNRLKKIVVPAQSIGRISCDGLEVFSPKALPFPYSRLATKYNTALIRKRILTFSKEKNIPVKRILLWTYMTTPLAVELARGLPWAGIVVDVVSDPCKVKGAEAIVKSHREMLGHADLILCASVPVIDLVRQQLDKNSESKLCVFEDGFSTRLIENTLGEENVCSELKKDNMENPIVAYIGGINNKIWWDAVSSMVLSLPEVNFIFAGPSEYSEFPCRQTNIKWIPPFPEYSQLGEFLANCKVGLIPYIPTSYVAEMRPAKINEYLVMGLPIVATRIPELERFAADNGPGLVYLADTFEEFPIMVRKALEEDCDDFRKCRLEIAQERSWEKVCARLEKFLNQEV